MTPIFYMNVEFWPLHVVWIWTWQVTYVPISAYPLGDRHLGQVYDINFYDILYIHIGFTVVGLHVDLSLDLMVIFPLKSMFIMFMWLAREVLQNASAGNTYKFIELLFSLSSSCSGGCHIFVCYFAKARRAFSQSILVSTVCVSVCLFVCLFVCHASYRPQFCTDQDYFFTVDLAYPGNFTFFFL